MRYCTVYVAKNKGVISYCAADQRIAKSRFSQDAAQFKAENGSILCV